MKTILWAVSMMFFAMISANAIASTPQLKVAAVLDDFHQAASVADGDRYFGHFSDDGVFLGTDASERWTVSAFKEFAKPHFSKGKGWTYKPTGRNVGLSADGTTAWFDERLMNQSYGECRGSGVLKRVKGEWKIAQYNLTIPVPNSLAKKVVKMIRELPAE